MVVVGEEEERQASASGATVNLALGSGRMLHTMLCCRKETTGTQEPEEES